MSILIVLFQIQLTLILSSCTDCVLINSTIESSESDKFDVSQLNNRGEQLQKTNATLGLALFVDQIFLDRLSATQIDVNTFLRYMMKTIDLRFNEPSIRSNLRTKLNFQVVYYEVTQAIIQRSLDGRLNGHGALQLARSYSQNHPNRTTYNWDYSLFLTGTNFATEHSSSQRYRTDLLGVAFTNLLCDGGTALIEMTSFDDWWVLIHEIGHSLSARHDHESGCDDLSTIMSAVVNADKTFWSSCSLDFFRTKLSSSETQNCLYRNNRKGKPLENFDLPSDLPGQVFSYQEMCQAGKSKNARYFGLESCRAMVCRLNWFQWKTLALPEGTPCGEGYVCCAGECVLIHECNRFLGLSG